jgi:penicillin amidase
VTRKLNLKKFLPDVDSSLEINGPISDIAILRDPFGIPHVTAANTTDAFFGQGFATAQDRLWQMDSDRRRAYGSWAELVGPTGLEQDLLMRRFRLKESSESDYKTLNQQTIDMLEAYASGVNAFIKSTQFLPVEYKLLESFPDLWTAWDCLSILKVRHILMGVYEAKIWRARLVKAIGIEKTALLHPHYEKDSLLILPPGSEYSGSTLDALMELDKASGALEWLNPLDIGSNNWVVSGKLTSSGLPLMAGDPHRGLDTPNVYYQNHISCPEFDAIGCSFAGVPGLPHFGHNSYVCWGVTHTGADYQDLFIERFKKKDPTLYLYKEKWQKAKVTKETVKVRGRDDQDLILYATHHGPIIAGHPSKGVGISFRYTQTARPNNSADSILEMLKARSTFDLDNIMEKWVDPCNNLVFCDVHGNIGYLTRGKLPIRSRANAWLPVAGWTGAHEWRGTVPFSEMPRCHNPKQNYIVTANQKVVDDDYPHFIALDHSPEFRARRITNRLLSLKNITVGDMSKIHGDRTSIPAQKYVELLKKISVDDNNAKTLLNKFLTWDGSMEQDLMAPLIYNEFRSALDYTVFHYHLKDLAKDGLKMTGRGGPIHLAKLRASLPSVIERNDRSLLPPNTSWDELLSQAFVQGIKNCQATLGKDITNWTWGSVHRTDPRHNLDSIFPDLAPLLNPPSISMGGDGETPQNTGFHLGNPYTINSTSVLRYVYDPSNWDNSSWIVPLGASGNPGSPHYSDQASFWAEIKLIPMLYNWDRIEKLAESKQVISSPNSKPKKEDLGL